MGTLRISWLENMATTWSDRFLLACWQGGLFILAVWLACRIFRRLPAAARHWLWWLACLKLLVSLFCVTPFDLPILPIAPAPRVIVGSRYELPTPPVEVGNGSIPRSPASLAQASLLSPRTVLFAIW